MSATACPRCRTPVRIGMVRDRPVAYEPREDPDNPIGELTWVLHDDDHFEFAALIAMNFYGA